MRRQIGLGLIFAFGLSGTSWAIDPIDTDELVREVTAGKLRNHLEALQAIAAKNDNNRALGTSGYRRSVEYAMNNMVNAGLDVRVQPFTANLFEENSPPRLVQLQPNREAYEANLDFATMTYSGADDVSTPLALARGIRIPPSDTVSSDSGCSPDDFRSNVAGKVVLIQRGTCTFFEKARNAQRAGAVGAIIFNEGQEGRQEVLNGTLGSELRIPVVGTTFQLGRSLYNTVRNGQDVRVRLAVDSKTTPVDTWNVIGEIEGRVGGQDVVVGAHLDSVEEGPGHNDNGSGTAALLVILEQMAKLDIVPRNTVRFAFWGAEEQGLFGSTHYVTTLGPRALSRIGLNLNFDMLGSPNFVRFVYDGDGSAFGTSGPTGSDEIEQVFKDFFESRGLKSAPTEFDGRSDYLAFIENGIPAGGLFSGAEGVKTERQARIYGGRAGRAYDPCYHQACDDISNLSDESLSKMGKAAAHTVLTFAMTREDIRGAAAPAMAAAAAAAAEYRGPNLVR